MKDRTCRVEGAIRQNSAPRFIATTTLYGGRMSEITEIPKRLRPKKDTVRELYLLSGNQCAQESCANPILNSDGTLYGDIAHIRGALPTSARFEPSMTNEERRAVDNLLLLCKLHHADVDNPELVEKYPVEVVRDMKTRHEGKYQAAVAALTHRIGDSTVGTSVTYPANLRALGHDPEDEEFPKVLAMVSAFADLLATVPPGTRQLLTLAIIHGDVHKLFGSSDDVTIDPARLREVATRISRHDVDELMHVLKGYGLADLDRRDEHGRPLWGLTGSTPAGEGWDIYVALREIADGDRSIIERAVNHLDFSVLDAD